MTKKKPLSPWERGCKKICPSPSGRGVGVRVLFNFSPPVARKPLDRSR
jgi:hypothetical protein